MNPTTQHPVVIVGGGIAGLVSAALVARAGLPAVVLEKASATGGRAATREKNGFRFNLGPHALYRHGALSDMLRQLGVEVTGAVPGGNGGFAIRGGRRHTLPVGLTSLMTTSVMGLPAKFEFARLQRLIASADASGLQGKTLESWLQSALHHDEVRDLVRMLVRVTTFTNDPQRQSAGAAIDQLRLAFSGNVLYLNGGWQTVVDGLRRVAVASGVRIESGAHAVALERRDARSIGAVRLADGRHVPASSVIVAATPEDVDALSGVTQFAGTLTPVRVATLDLALTSLPQRKRIVAFGADEPTYFSVHSAVARLAPEGGALIHVAKYLGPDEIAGRDVERTLEQLADDMQPGWRNVIAAKYFLPSLTVTNAELVASSGGLAGRPSPRVAAFDNVFVAGDWVGSRGQLSDAAAASAADAAEAVVSRRSSVISPAVVSPAVA
jgi:phytoene dehydrogenase-like protein